MQLSAIIASLGRFLAELQRRKVLRIAAGYVVGAWIVLQVALALQTAMSLSGQFSAAILALLVIGFFITLVLAWFYEITPEGVKRTAPATGDAPLVKPQTTDLALAGALTLVVVVALVQLLTTSPPAPPSAAPTTTAEATPTKPEPPALGDKSIAVLPFANLSPDKENEYFADGLTEEILNLLASIPDLKVVSRTSSFAFKGKETSVPEIARKLGVRHVLEGSVRAVGDDLRVTAKLIDVVTDTQVWSETYRRKLENIFALQGDIADSIAGALKVEVTLTSKDRDAPTKDLEAYRYYLDGLNEYRQRDAPPGARVIDLFDRAVARDPKFAEAHAALAAAYFSQLNFELDDARQWAARARASAEAALGLNPKLGLAHGILGVLDRGDLDWEAAVASGRKAVALDSANSFTHFWLGTTLARLGYTGEAAKLIEEAHRVDPLHRVASVWPMIIEANRGNWEGAERIARTIAESQRSLTLHNYYLTSWAFGRGDGATAEKYYRLAISPADKDRPFVAAVIKALHSKQATNAAIAALEAEAASNANFEPHRHFFVLRADDAIIRRVTQQIESGDTQRLVYTMLAGIWSPPFKALRNDPRFKDVLRRLRLVDYWKKHGWPDRCRPKGEDDFECS